ncbi:MAG: baseplate J/gp47 family protein, partial [Ruminiclostridium sp.]
TVEFTTTLGAEGNLPAGEINSFLDPVPFVDSVYNPEPAYGGRSIEEFSVCAARGADKVRTLERCISESDFETAARNADSTIARAKCRSADGRVRLTLLTRSRDIPLFRLARQNVLNAILPAMPFYLQRKPEVNQAAYVEIEVTAHVVSDGKAFPQTIQNDIRNRLEKFLDPVNGNTAENGFEIGEYPSPESVAAVILSSKHILSADRVQLLCRYRGSVFDYSQISSEIEDGVPVCGNTAIYITEKNEL